MVVVEALKCAQCGKQCDRALIDGTNYDIAACSKCAMLVCGTCTLTHYGRARANCCREAAHFLSNFCTFLNYGPEEELRLIDLQTNLAVNCSKCNALPFDKDIYRCNIQQASCGKYLHSTMNSWRTRDPLERLFQKIIRELNTSAIMPRTRPQRDGVSGALPVKINANCNTCRRELGVLSPASYCPIVLDGVAYCLSCGDKAYRYFPTSQRCYCLSRLIDFIQCIPENQLPLLTYSKWLKAVDCKQHQDMLYELNVVSADGSRTDKLRTFFKKEEDISHKFNTAISEKSTGSSSSSTLAPSIADSLFPARIVCACGREEELPNVFDCTSCCTYGVCTVCLADHHWGHDVARSLKTLTLCLLNSRSKLTGQKLNRLSDQAVDVYKKSEKSFEKLCHILGIVFKEAAMKSGDLHQFQSLLAKANISEIEKHFNKITEGTVKLHKMVDSLCEDLMDAVGEETPSANTSVQAVLPADIVEEKSE